MRYRKLDVNGDMMFGHGVSDFLINSPEAVAQAVLTRLKLHKEEWFVDISKGVPYETDILGAHTQATRDLAVQEAIVGTQGVLELLSYSSNIDSDRGFHVSAFITTVYSTQPIEVST